MKKYGTIHGKALRHGDKESNDAARISLAELRALLCDADPAVVRLARGALTGLTADRAACYRVLVARYA